MAILRRAFNLARVTVIEGIPLLTGPSPLDGVALPKPKNARERFLSYAEADKLLEAAQECGHADLHTAIVIALNTGMRLGEILRLEWIDVDMAHGIITVREEADRKPGGKVFINTEVEAVLNKYISCQRHSQLVLAPPKGGKERSSLTHRFSDLVEELGFNAGIEDARHKVVFHTLRHTFASWLALAGTDIYRIKALMRHKTITMNREHAIFGASRCVAVSPSDTAPALVALEAQFVIRNGGGSRTVAAEDYFVGPADDITRLNVLGPGDILTEIRIPKTWAGATHYFEKVRDRPVWDFPLVGIAAVMHKRGDRIEQARFVLSAVAAKPWRLPRVEAAVAGKATRDAAAAAEKIAAAGAAPLTHNAYKVTLTRNLVKRAIRGKEAA